MPYQILRSNKSGNILLVGSKDRRSNRMLQCQAHDKRFFDKGYHNGDWNWYNFNITLNEYQVSERRD